MKLALGFRKRGTLDFIGGYLRRTKLEPGIGRDLGGLLGIEAQSLCDTWRASRAPSGGIVACPSDYSAEIAETICDRLIDGGSLRSICDGAGMPDKAPVFRWLARHHDFRAWHTIAREVRMDELLYEAVKIADNCASDRASIKLARLQDQCAVFAGGPDGAEKIRPQLKVSRPVATDQKESPGQIGARHRRPVTWTGHTDLQIA